MKCPEIQRHLLGSENPDRPSPSVREHLSGCPACQSWQHRLVQIEKDVRGLPLPPSEGKLPFVNQFRMGTIAVRSPSGNGWLPWQVRERGRRKLALAASLAASLLLFVLGWWIIQRGANGPGPANDINPPLTFAQEQRATIKQAMENAQSPRDRLMVYKDHTQILVKRLETAKGEELSQLVSFCSGEFIQDGILAEANQLPADQREEVLSPVAEKLEGLSKEAEYWTRYREGTDGEQLRKLAVAAKKGAEELRRLYA